MAETIEDLKELFSQCMDAENLQREQSLLDLQFGRAAIQWPEEIAKERLADGRPMLTINKLPTFIRQVVNDARQNRPDIKVKPVTGGNISTANVFAGLIKNIEAVSRADIAYDTAADFAVSCGVGYFRVDVEYEGSMSFDKKLSIKRVPNVFSVYGDFNSKEPDSSDWNFAFVVDTMSKEVFEKEYKGADQVNWEDNGYVNMQMPWRTDNEILVAEAWRREKTITEILLLSNGEVVTSDTYKEVKAYFDTLQLSVTQTRKADGYKIIQYMMSGEEILETTEWAGKYIPIIPVYGEEINIEGKRRFNSLIWGSKDAQRMFNYWRTTSTELVALAPRVPFIGEEGTFDVDGETSKWLTSNTRSHPYLQYKRGMQPPERHPLDAGPAVGAMSEALAAADDMKSTMGMYDASLGQKSNETSGRAIMARQHEGDVSTFHFVDNLSRAIRHCGNVLVDLIPKVYTSGRVVRIIQPDKKEVNVRLTDNSNPGALSAPGMPAMGPPPNVDMTAPGSPMSPSQQSSGPGAPSNINPSDPDGITGIYNLGAGEYDVAVDSGPSYTTRREEVAAQMMEMVKQAPQLLPIIGDILVQALDWPRADEIAQRLKAAQSQQVSQIPPQLQAKIQQGMDKIRQLETENAILKAKLPTHIAKTHTDEQNVRISEYDAETRRIAAINANNRDVESNIMDFHEGIFGAMDTLHQNQQAQNQQQFDNQQALAQPTAPSSMNGTGQ